MTLAVSHTSHGFTDPTDIGKAVRSSGTDGQFIIARANNAVNSEVVGIITSIEGANNYTITTSGFVDVVAAVPTATAGTVYFLAEADDSQLTSTEPTTDSAISKPVAVITESNAKMLLIHYRGEVISSNVQTNAPNDAQYVALAANGTLTNERVLTAGSGITLTDAGAGGAATISIANDAIDSQHYAATSIDNEHLADNAVNSDELAAGAVDIAHLSASGTASNSTFLRGDNAWAAAGGGALTFVGKATASNSSTLGITGIDGTYENYLILGSDLVPASDHRQFQLQFGLLPRHRLAPAFPASRQSAGRLHRLLTVSNSVRRCRRRRGTPPHV